MKVARFLLLVLLALVLPLRGALANIACCSGDLAGVDLAITQVHDHGASAHADGAQDAHHAHAHDDDGAGAEANPCAPDKCHACTAACSAAPIVSALPVLPLPAASGDVVFPALLTPPPSHASERQERPPRSC